MDEPTQRWISVTAEGQATVTPDMAIMSAAVSGDGRELEQTRDDVNARRHRGRRSERGARERR